MFKRTAILTLIFLTFVGFTGCNKKQKPKKVNLKKTEAAKASAELPVIEFERTRITQVFQNLLSNAVKYMDKPEGQVRIGCVGEDRYWKFSVADNGPGIEEKYFKKIFQMFQTLAPRDEHESTGVGLTVAKKIVELYGGRIWVESKVGQGSTFFFTLPKQEMGVKNEKLEVSAVM
jgi:signal transduction histidine kinase